MDDRIRKIADHYGIRLQIIQLIQEAAELIEAGTKFTFDADAGYNHLSEEIADVEIMTEQIKYLTGSHGLVEAWKGKKLERQMGRIKGEE